MKITQQGVVWRIEFTYNKSINAYVKSLGAKFIGRAWTLPIHEIRIVDHLREKFCAVNASAAAPEKYGIIPELPELTTEQKELLSKELTRPLYHYQEKGVAYSILHKRVMNGDDMGAGKTSQAIAWVVGSGLRNKCGLIISKGAIKYNWEREFKIVAGMQASVLTDYLKDTWYQYHQLTKIHTFITNYESIEKFFVQKINKVKGEMLRPENITWKLHPITKIPYKDLFDYIILDESHEIRNEDTTKSVLCVGMGLGKEHKLCLTGTPIVNRALDIYPQLNFLGKTKNTKESRKAFIDRYCGGDGKKSTNSKELHYNLSVSCYFRRNRSEFGLDLPELTQQLVYCEITNRKEYDHALKDLGGYLQQYRGKTDEQVEKSLAGEIMVQIQVCQNIAARGKIRDAVEQIDEILMSGNKMVVGVNQREIKDIIVNHYRNKGVKVFVISGAENADQKWQAECGFKESRLAVCVVSIKAGGVGINLQTACYIMNMEYPWQPALYYQFLARVHRNGQENKVTSINLLGKNTIDERMWEIIESKKDIANAITGNEDDIQREIINKISTELFGIK